MTRKEAIKELKAFKNKSWDGMPEEVIDMAIEALSSLENSNNTSNNTEEYDIYGDTE